MKDESLSQPEHQLSTVGLRCPEPVMLLHKQMRDMAVGERVEVIATDPPTQRDIPKFCQFLGHALLKQEVLDDQWVYWIQKNPA